MHYENQVYAHLRNAFNELKISMKGKVLKMDEILDERNSKEKTNKNKI